MSCRACTPSSSAARRCTCASTATLHGSPGQLASLRKLTFLLKQCMAFLFGSLTGLAQKVAQHLQHLRISLTVFRLPSCWLSILFEISDQGAGDLQQCRRQQGYTALFQRRQGMQRPDMTLSDMQEAHLNDNGGHAIAARLLAAGGKCCRGGPGKRGHGGLCGPGPRQQAGLGGARHWPGEALCACVALLASPHRPLLSLPVLLRGAEQVVCRLQ